MTFLNMTDMALDKLKAQVVMEKRLWMTLRQQMLEGTSCFHRLTRVGVTMYMAPLPEVAGSLLTLA